MKKFYSLMAVALAAVVATPAYAAEVKENQTEKTEGTLILKYWNGVNEKGNYYPNWEITTNPEGQKIADAVSVTWKLTKDGADFKNGNGNQSDFQNGHWSAWFDLGQIEKGEYVMTSTFTLTNAGVDTTYELETKWSYGGMQTDVPVISDFVCSNPKGTGDTTGTVDYKITVINPDKVEYFVIWANKAGDAVVSAEKQYTEAEGTIELTDLGSKTETEIWVKVKAAYKDAGGNIQLTEQAQYPGAAQNWGGFKVNTAIAAGMEVPTLTLLVDDAKALTQTTGSLHYVITAEKAANVKNYTVWAVKAGEVLLGQVETEELEGVLPVKDLNKGANTEIWVKVFATLEDGTALGSVAENKYQAQFPGEAQGWSGLAIDTTGAPEDTEAVEFIEEDAEVEAYFDLQGRKVANPEAGLYIVRLSNGKAAKVLVK